MTKQITFFLVMLVFGDSMYAQSVGINDDGSSPNSKAMLDVKSTTKGLLPPRMTEAERNAITVAPAGLIIWCTNCGASGEMQVYNGTAWTNMVGGSASPAPFVCGDPLVDARDNKSYSTVLIGTQCWMAQNLNVGTKINGSGNQENNNIIEKYCYDDIESNCDTYGGLYQWTEAMQYSTTPGVRGLCPAGWHFPTDAEWTTLTSYVNSQTSYQCSSTSGCIGKAMAAMTLWNSSTETCTPGNNLSLNNATGFLALPGGIRANSMTFFFIGSYGFWWNSSENSTTSAWERDMDYNGCSVYSAGNVKDNGFSVRCVQD